MVLASHVIFSMYGFWLPNDQRGSWSEFVGAWELLRFGTATKVDTRRSVAGACFDPELRRDAKTALKYPAVSLSGTQARAVARGFSNHVNRSGVKVLACSILPEHVHMVIARHTFEVEQVHQSTQRHRHAATAGGRHSPVGGVRNTAAPLLGSRAVESVSG